MEDLQRQMLRDTFSLINNATFTVAGQPSTLDDILNMEDVKNACYGEYQIQSILECQPYSSNCFYLLGDRVTQEFYDKYITPQEKHRWVVSNNN